MNDPLSPNTQDSNPPSRRRFWAVLLVLDTILVCVFGGWLVSVLVLNGNPPDFLKGLIEPPPPAHAVPRHGAQPKSASPSPPPEPAPSTPPPPAPASPPPAPSPETALQEPQKAKPVEFVCPGKGAKRVYLRGAFIPRTGKRRMKKGSDGQWRLSSPLYLKPGSYKYYCNVNGKDSEPMTMDVSP